MGDTSCTHLDEIAVAVENYHLVLAYYVTCIAEDAFKRKAFDGYCRLCLQSNRRIHACLECSFFGCFDSENGKKSHIEEHYLEKKHSFAIHLNHGCLFCFQCGDYIYNETFEDIFKEYKLEAIKINDYRPYMPWKPKAEEIALLKGKIKKVADDSYIGLRGLVNIGNSCYFNVIIQVFVHNPILRDFFLLDQHKCFLKEKCLTCEMFVLFQDFYSGIEASYNPSKRFFVALQDYCPWVLGGEQQDAKEMFQEILRGLHDSCEETRSKDMHDCNCLIHQTFYGVIQETRLCSQCDVALDFPLDHFMDILLDLESDDDSLVKLLNRKYLEPHLLSTYKCSECGGIDKTYLTYKIKKLPNVMCIRMNCFEVKKDDKVVINNEEVVKKKEKALKKKEKVVKKQTAFAFEEWIDMSPYLNSKGNKKLANENRYQLYAVIFHKSEKNQIDSGHYAVFVRQRRNQWFECDDQLIYKGSLEGVLSCNPVLLFYCKHL